jgi:hypothetical protein
MTLDMLQKCAVLNPGNTPSIVTVHWGNAIPPSV